MEYFIFLFAAYTAFVTGVFLQGRKAHKKWESEVLPLRQENARLKTLLNLHGIEIKQ